MQEVKGTGMDALGALLAEMTARGLSYTAEVQDASPETKPGDRCWSVVVKGY